MVDSPPCLPGQSQVRGIQVFAVSNLTKTKVPQGGSVLVSMVPILFVWQKAVYVFTDVCNAGFHMLKQKISFANEENNALNMTVGHRGNKMDFAEKD